MLFNGHFSLLYDLEHVYICCRNKQFAVVENPGFWNWTFTLKDIDGKVLAEIDRDWRGFGFEVILLLPFFSLLSFYCYLPQDT